MKGPRRGGRALGATLVAMAVVAGLAAPWLSPYDPYAQDLHHRLEGPSPSHWLGVDELGRDVGSRLLHGARVSLGVGLAVVACSALVGAALGALAGFTGGWLDGLLMRTADVFLAFPGILLAIAVVALLGPALSHLILALCAIGWVGYARLVRAQVLALAERDFVTAARAAGVPRMRVLVRHLLPHVAPTLAVQASLGIAGAILAEAGLSFLGLGVPPPSASWGSMINAGRGHLLDAPHLTLFPGFAIIVTVLGLNLLGESLAEGSGRKITAGGSQL
jgi:peptide/nickel transport system permease protein